MAQVFKNSNGLSLRLLRAILTNELLVMSRKHQKKTAIFLPYGKAEYPPSPLLPRVRRSLLQPHPWTPRISGILDFCNVRVNISVLGT